MNRVQSRRQLLRQALAVPLVLHAAAPSNRFEIISDGSLLSRESARGYRAVLGEHQPKSKIIVLTTARGLGAEQLSKLHRQVQQGAWLLWESPAHITYEAEALQRKQLYETFGIVPRPAKAVHAARTFYLHYHWPTNALVRTFSTITPVECAASEAIAHHEEEPVAIRKPAGLGHVVFLGSMLGPHLAAGDPQATALATRLLQLTSS